jgi:outer membrane protein
MDPSIMKKTYIVLTLCFLSILSVSAQKYAYVDTEYILDNIPEYKDAQNQLDDLAMSFQLEIEDKIAEIDKMRKNLQAEAVLMPDDVRDKRRSDIQEMEQKVKDLQQQRFGVGGDLFDKREELVRPIQEKIYNAIEEIATEKNYAFVFDKSGSLTILFSNGKFDISDEVLDKVGAELGTVRREDRVKKEYRGTPTTQQNRNRSQSSPAPPGQSSRSVNNSERK